MSEKLSEKEQELLSRIRSSQETKETYFKEVLQGKHPGKKLIEQKICIQYAEVIDYDKAKLVCEETDADEKANTEYLKSCTIDNGVKALGWAKELQEMENISVTAFNYSFRRLYCGENETPEVKIQAVDLSTGKVENLNDVPMEVKKKLMAALAGSIGELGEDEGEKKKEAEAEPATV